MSRTVKKILCAVDLSGHSKEVADFVRPLAQQLGAKVLVLYSAPTLSQYVGFHVPQSTIKGFVSEIVEGAQRGMDAFLAENFQGVDVESRVVVGYAAEMIPAVALEESCDLIVMGTHGRKGIDRLVFGSVAEKVVKNSTVPVLTLRPTAGYDEESVIPD